MTNININNAQPDMQEAFSRDQATKIITFIYIDDNYNLRNQF